MLEVLSLVDIVHLFLSILFSTFILHQIALTMAKHTGLFLSLFYYQSKTYSIQLWTYWHSLSATETQISERYNRNPANS